MSALESITLASAKQCSRCLLDFPNTPEFFYHKNGRCKPCAQIVAKEWALHNHEKRKSVVKKWDDTHKEQRTITRQARDRKNAAKLRAQLQAWRTQNRDRFNASSRARKKKTYAIDPAKFLAESAARRAKRKHAPINNFTAQQWRDMQAAYNHRCVYCGKRCKGKLTQDHITPLSKGGSHTLTNIVPACKNCNSKKKDNPAPIPVQPLLVL